MAKILLVEDDTDLAAVIVKGLGDEKHTLDWVDTGKEALSRLKFYEYELIILDWELPDCTGPEIASKYRGQGGSVPILMMTGRGALQDKVSGLDSGVDDYIVKPAALQEITARVRALLRRPSAVSPPVIERGALRLEPGSGKVFRDGVEIVLLPREFALLQFLMRHPNQVFSPDKLIDMVWPTTSEVARDTIKVHVKKIRDKIDVPDQPSIIKSIHGMGYVFEQD